MRVLSVLAACTHTTVVYHASTLHDSQVLGVLSADSTLALDRKAFQAFQKQRYLNGHLRRANDMWRVRR